jgi:hypothetical protein
MNPSQVTDKYWLSAHRLDNNYPQHTLRSGKWMIFLPWDQIDQAWENIKSITINGYLGLSSKVSTKKSNPNAKDPNMGVIIVYTYDYEDKEDVIRIREVLYDVGYTNRLIYKPDVATIERKYSKDGFKTGIYYM